MAVEYSGREPECQLEFAGNRQIHHVHVSCVGAWAADYQRKGAERQRRDAGAAVLRVAAAD
jgi:hypothetical protein